MQGYNPYAAPQSDTIASPGGFGPTPGQPQPWGIGEVLGQAWQQYKANWAVLTFAPIVAQIPGQVVGSIPQFLVMAGVMDAQSTASTVASIVTTIISFVIGCFFAAGLTKIFVDAARGGAAAFGDLFGGGSRFLAVLGVQVLVTLVIVLGALVFIVPGIIFALGLSFALYYVVDQRMGVIDGMRASWSAMNGNKLSYFGYGLLAGLITLGAALLCCLPIFVAWPVTSLGIAIIYTRVSGTASAAQTPPGYPPAGYYVPPPGYGAPPGPGYGPPPVFGPPPGYGPPPQGS